jgi:hypothetical protein
MKREYINPEIKVSNFAAENICTLSGVLKAAEDLKSDSSYATATVSLSDLIAFDD